MREATCLPPLKGKGAENMAERQLTNDTCPVCGSTSIEGWEVTMEGSLAIQECTCGACGVSWNDVYELHDRVVLEELRP